MTLWRLSDGKRLLHAELPHITVNSTVSGTAFSPDGNNLPVRTDSGVRVYWLGEDTQDVADRATDFSRSPLLPDQRRAFHLPLASSTQPQEPDRP